MKHFTQNNLSTKNLLNTKHLKSFYKLDKLNLNNTQGSYKNELKVLNHLGKDNKTLINYYKFFLKANTFNVGNDFNTHFN